MAWMVAALPTTAAGCIHAQRISPHLKFQAYNDAELFWIIKNGVRLSGMPAFGKVESDERIWHLVRYVRTMRRAESP
jgi:mono/diheme cytochrome c family protein